MLPYCHHLLHETADSLPKGLSNSFKYGDLTRFIWSTFFPPSLLMLAGAAGNSVTKSAQAGFPFHSVTFLNTAFEKSVE